MKTLKAVAGLCVLLLGCSCSGDDGVDGLPGDNGNHGVDGEPGQNGKDGSNGVDGNNGVDGVDGVNGMHGMDGTNGTVGPAGPQGPPGPQGPQGPAGGSFFDPAQGIVNGTSLQSPADFAVDGTGFVGSSFEVAGPLVRSLARAHGNVPRRASTTARSRAAR